MVAKGVLVDVVQRLLSHISIQTSIIYVRAKRTRSIQELTRLYQGWTRKCSDSKHFLMLTLFGTRLGHVFRVGTLSGCSSHAEFFYFWMAQFLDGLQFQP
ncbi:hypothetical protein IHE32_12890 (plasmid) [Mycetohabitans rhizoxinica]